MSYSRLSSFPLDRPLDAPHRELTHAPVCLPVQLKLIDLQFAEYRTRWQRERAHRMIAARERAQQRGGSARHRGTNPACVTRARKSTRPRSRRYTSRPLRRNQDRAQRQRRQACLGAGCAWRHFPIADRRDGCVQSGASSARLLGEVTGTY
jgi:hypothetical protein